MYNAFLRTVLFIIIVIVIVIVIVSDRRQEIISVPSITKLEFN